MNAKNKQALPVAIVTGAGRRIGKEIILALHEAIYRVVIHCFKSKKEAEELASFLNNKRLDSALVISGDLKNHLFLKALVHKTITWGKRLDVIINNASIFKNNTTITAAIAQELFSVNTLAPYFLNQFAYPYLKKTNGIIINISDIHATKPLKDYSIYCQTKAALNMQTKSLAKEFAPKVRVNAIAPGAILWPESENKLSQAAKEKIIKKTLLQQHGDPKYITQAVLFLIQNKFITGHILSIDGGRIVK